MPNIGNPTAAHLHDMPIVSAVSPFTTVTTIIKYEITGSSNVRTRPIFNFEFPQRLYVVLE